MVAPTDPKGINTAGSPKELDYSIESWGYVHGRQSRNRLFIGAAVFVIGVLLIFGAFLMYRFGTTNQHKVSEDFFRSRELSPAELKSYIKENNIRTVIRLVGTEDSNRESFEIESAAIADTDATLVVAALPSSRLPWRSELLRLFEALDGAERPMHVHCQAGSDRTGLVSTIWLHDYKGRPMAEARSQMAFFPYGHFEFGAASELGRFLDMYEAYSEANPNKSLSIREWVRLHYFEEKPGREVAGNS